MQVTSQKELLALVDYWLSVAGMRVDQFLSTGGQVHLANLLDDLTIARGYVEAAARQEVVF